MLSFSSLQCIFCGVQKGIEGPGLATMDSGLVVFCPSDTQIQTTTYLLFQATSYALWWNAEKKKQAGSSGRGRREYDRVTIILLTGVTKLPSEAASGKHPPPPAPSLASMSAAN